LGCATVLSLFGAVKNPVLSEKLYNVLKEYIGNFILYDPPYQAFGYPLPQDNPNYTPVDDPTLTGDILKVFSDWVGSYYDHPCLAYTASIYDLDGRRKTEKNSISSWTTEETVKGIEGDKAKNDLLMFLPAMQQTLCELAQQALFDGEAVQQWFPNVNVTYLGATRTNWAAAWAEMETKKRYHDVLNSLKQVRNINFFDIIGGNHFVSIIVVFVDAKC
ncbi:hypothetical protein BDP27DRAFT_1234184, partial [Rhodocollybia butyracea]